MFVEGISSVGKAPGEAAELPSEIVNHMVYAVRGNTYDRQAAQLLALASAWEYSDVTTFGSVMANHGLKGCNCAIVKITNDALLVDTSALLVQSENRRLLILCFQGTQPKNAVNWMTDLTAKKVPFYSSAGYVHGGFHRALLVLQPVLGPLLKFASEGKSICDALEKGVQPTLWTHCGRIEAVDTSNTTTASDAKKLTLNEKDAQKDLAFYITGHSLGGALAALAGAHVYSNVDLQNLGLMDHLRGVYTYGQPMVGDPTFVDRLHDTLGKNLFRHVYKRDIVPRLPSRTMGRFAHVGEEFVSTEDGWVYKPVSVSQAITVVASNILGAAAYVFQQVLPFGWEVPFSWADHSPLNYLHTSLAVPSGSEIV